MSHVTRVWREKKWPHQWIGQCENCNVGTRCNDREYAERFMRDHRAEPETGEKP